MLSTGASSGKDQNGSNEASPTHGDERNAPLSEDTYAIGSTKGVSGRGVSEPDDEPERSPSGKHKGRRPAECEPCGDGSAEALTDGDPRRGG